jgi:hypothetical protein
MAFGQKLAGLAVDYRITNVGAGFGISSVVKAHISWLDAIRTSREPGYDADYSGHRILSRDYTNLIFTAAGGTRSNAKDL